MRVFSDLAWVSVVAVVVQFMASTPWPLKILMSSVVLLVPILVRVPVVVRFRLSLVTMAPSLVLLCSMLMLRYTAPRTWAWL